jgi:hypothetical protein
MTHTPAFIEDAMEGGIDYSVYINERDDTPPAEQVLSDYDFNLERELLKPEVWQAVGKVRGWPEERYLFANYYHRISGFSAHGSLWQFNMHRFIEQLADGKTIDEALGSL